MLTFKKGYFLIALLIFITEVLIALFVKDQFVRPYLGDTLVVILIYCFIKSFFQAPVVPVAISVLLFSFLIETLQYFNFVAFLGLEDSRLANVVLGNSFHWGDILAYTAGIVLIYIIEKIRRK